MKILIVEDETEIREGIIEYAKALGYQCMGASNGVQAVQLFKQEMFDLVLLDIMLPHMNGLEVLRQIRMTSKVPVLMLTAFGDEDYKMRAFTHLADGYIEKPFSLPLLGARIKAIEERYYSAEKTFVYQDCVVDFSSYTAEYQGNSVPMHRKELDVLQCLLEHANTVLTRSQIINNLWGDEDEPPFDRVIDVYVKELRRKLGLDCIVTVRNVGYMLKVKK